MPKISVIIPAYNAAPFIERCIRSVLVQTFQDFEIIIVDDGSKDTTVSICKHLQECDTRIRLFSKENGGANSARHFGVMQAKGDYIRFSDADDTMPPKSLALLIEKATTHQLDITQGASTYKTICGKVSYSKYAEEGVFDKIVFIQKLFMGQSHAGPHCSLYKKNLFNEDTFNLDREVILKEDLYMNICLGISAQRIGLFNDILIYEYWQNNESLTHTYKHTSIRPIKILYDQIEIVLRKARIYDLLAQEMYISKIWQISSSCFQNSTFCKDVWVQQTFHETPDAILPFPLRISKIAILHPKTLFPLLRCLNWIKKKWKKM